MMKTKHIAGICLLICAALVGVAVVIIWIFYEPDLTAAQMFWKYSVLYATIILFAVAGVLALQEVLD